ncbi:hypothetical protein B0H66DRAFT_608475 [Apodospora peruviana]|uniref:Uncharacterized protein n=1 Tax=Apodospora peruviana TaxID=516989 RepID=A0AAE0LYA6_9PEZI|nr:hypothetical protein B0H66DRAFT_608475 [Apodospora peruviana]
MLARHYLNEPPSSCRGIRRSHSTAEDSLQAVLEASANQSTVGHSVLSPSATSHLPGTVGHLDNVLGKRGLFAYMFFANEQRENVREENPGVSTAVPTAVSRPRKAGSPGC